MAQQQIPFISAPFKRTDDVDWILPIKRYIAQVYQDDPEKYNEETYALNRLRQDIRGAGKDLTGRDLLYRYFGQLELLDLRFPVDEKHIKILFTWYDAFNGRPTSQYSLAYEKASVIFNTAATLSAIAAAQNRGEVDGRKRAFNFFQASAGVFQYINDNFLHAPSQDLHRDTVKMLTELMLAQAHECFIENSLREKKKDNLIAKLASHAAWVYGNLADEIQECISRNVGVERGWMVVCQIKQKFYQAIAQQHRAGVCELDRNYGEQVSRLAAAEATAKEAVKLVGSNTSAMLQASHTLSADSATVLQELCKSLAATLSEKHSLASRDNDMIYHDNVPKESILTPIDRLKAVKTVPISELYGQNEVSKVIGGDIFSRLIPLSVHESASMYSEEKAKLVRAEVERCDIAKAELSASLEYMKLPKSLDKFKQGKKTDEAILDAFAVPPSEARGWADRIADEESNNTITMRELIENLCGLKSRAAQMLDQVSFALDQEMRDCEAMRSKYEAEWAQQPSGTLTSDFRQDLRNHRESLNSASQSDTQLLRAYENIASNIDILRKGGKSKALEALFAERVTKTFIKPSTDNSRTLLDLELDVNLSAKSMDVKVKRAEAALEKLQKLETDRRNTLQDLKEKTMQDDISNLLILNKKNANIEQQIFTSELEKFRPHQQRISASIHQQQQITQELTFAFKALMEGDDAQKLQSQWDAAEKQRRLVADQLEKAYSIYMDTKNGMRKGIEFYSSLCDVIESLLNNASTFVQERSQERGNLVEKLESTRSNREQVLLKEKLSKYTDAAPMPSSSSPNAPSIDTNPSIAQLTEKARDMGLGSSIDTFYGGQQITAAAAAAAQTPAVYSSPAQSYSQAPPQPMPYTNFSLSSVSQQQQQQQQQEQPLYQPQLSRQSQLLQQPPPPPQPQPTAPPALQRAPSYSSSTNSYTAPYVGAYCQPPRPIASSMPSKDTFNVPSPVGPPIPIHSVPYQPPTAMYNTGVPPPSSAPMAPYSQPKPPQQSLPPPLQTGGGYTQSYQQQAPIPPTPTGPNLLYSQQQPPPLPSKPPQIQSQPLTPAASTPSYYSTTSPGAPRHDQQSTFPPQMQPYQQQTYQQQPQQLYQQQPYQKQLSYQQQLPVCHNQSYVQQQPFQSGPPVPQQWQQQQQQPEPSSAPHPPPPPQQQQQATYGWRPPPPPQQTSGNNGSLLD